MALKKALVLIATWLLAGFGSVVGSIFGNAAGRVGLFLGAIIGGLLATAGAVLLEGKLGWIDRRERGGAMVGALVGFAIAAPIAASNLHTPITPVAVTSLAGIGALVGAGFRRR